MKPLLERLRAHADKVAACVDIEDDLRLNEACSVLLGSVPVKRRSEVENALIAVVHDGDPRGLNLRDRERLARRGFAELVARAAERRRSENV